MLDGDQSLPDGITSPIAAHILDFCDDGSGGGGGGGGGGDLFAASSEDASSEDNMWPSLDSTLSALLEDDQPPGPDAELLLLPIDYAEQQQFGQMVLPVAAAVEVEHHQVLQTQMSSTASEIMQLDEFLMLPAAVGEAAAQGGFLGGSTSSMMSMMLGMEEMGEYQRMMVDAADSSAAQMEMAFPAASEMQEENPAFPSRAESSSLDDTSCFKAARLSVEERKEKIHRYIKKRNERNFSKKIKYACRKTLADSRPRVRGRFAKNDEYCESSAAIGSRDHEYDQMMSGVKGEDILDPEALAHISGISSYMYNHTVESWI